MTSDAIASSAIEDNLNGELEIDPATAPIQLKEEAEALRAGLEDLFDHVRLTQDDTDQDIASSSQSLIEEQFMMLISQYSSDALSLACLVASADTQRLPIHLACEYSAPVPVIRYLLDLQYVLSFPLPYQVASSAPCSMQNPVSFPF